jgi:lysophospholipase L1-like esterase
LTNRLALAAVAIVVLVACTDPRTEPVEPARIVTLGDSYSSGLGIHRDASDYDDHGPPEHSFDPDTRLGASTCHREIDTTPGPRIAVERGLESVFVACAGASIADMSNQVEAAAIPGDGAGTIVVLTVGGNDARTEDGDGWPTTLIECITSFGCDDDSGGIANADEIEARLTIFLAELLGEYPRLTVRVPGYPVLMQPDRWGCLGVTGVGSAEANWVDDQVAILDAAIERAVGTVVEDGSSELDLEYVPVDAEFENHGACRTFQRDRFVNDALKGERYRREMTADGEVVDHYDDGLFTISASSFHPSQAGYDAYFRALDVSLDTSPEPGE